MRRIDLVGPHGYVHGWIFVGIPGVHNPRGLQPGDKFRTSFGHGLSAEHEVVGVKHTSNMTTARVRNIDTGEIHTMHMPHATPGKARISPPHDMGGGGKLPTGKAAETTAGRRAALKAGHALPPTRPGGRPGFPVTDPKHWDKAFEAVGRSGGGARRAALRKLLIKTAPEFGKTGRIKGSWLDRSKNMSNTFNLARMTCPNCGYADDDAAFSQTNDGGDTTRMAAALRTPANSNLQSATGFNSGQIGLSNVIALSGRPRQPVLTPNDILVTRGDNGRAIIRHRRGGDKIGEVFRNENGQWTSSIEGGGDLGGHTHQRGALNELVGTHNKASGTAYHRPSEPLIPRPVQTPLMERFGVPAATVLATPSNGDSDGPRVTGSSASGPGGLGPKGVTIYKRLIAKGFPAPRALAFARRAQNMGGSGD